MTHIFWQSLLLAATSLFPVGSTTIVILLPMTGPGWENGIGYALIGVWTVVLG